MPYGNLTEVHLCSKLYSYSLFFFYFCVCEYQGRSQTSEQDEACFERQRREPLGRSGGMPPPGAPPPPTLKIFEI